MKGILTAILVVLTAALLGYVIWSEKSLPDPLAEKALLDKALHFKPEDVDTVRLRLDKTEILLQKQGASSLWRVRHLQSPAAAEGQSGDAQPKLELDDRADQEKVEALIAALSDLPVLDRFSSTVAEKSRLPAKYVIGPTVTLWKGSTLLGEIVVGQSGTIENSNYALVRRGVDDHDVLLVGKKLNNMVAVNSAPWRDSKLADIPSDRVRVFRVVSELGEVELQREDTNAPWRFVKPMNTPANNGMVTEIVDLLTDVRVTSFLDDAPPDSGVKPIGSYTLASENAEITVHLHPDPASPPPPPAGLSAENAPAAVAPVLATCSDRAGLFRVPGDLMNLARLQPNQLRDRRLGHLSSKQINTVDVLPSGLPAVHLRKPGETWLLQTGSNEFQPANSARVTDLIRKVNEAQIRDFVSDTAESPEQYGLDKPVLQVRFGLSTFGQGAEGQVEQKGVSFKTLRIGHGPTGGVYANWAGEPFVYLVDSAVETSIPTTLLRWRSTTLLEISSLSLRELRFLSPGKPELTLDLDPNTMIWAGKRGGEDISDKLNLVRVDELSSRIASLTAMEWVGDASGARQALANPTQTIEILAAVPDPNDPLATIPLRTTLKIVPLNPATPLTPESLCYGTMDGVLDIFYLTGAHVKELDPETLVSSQILRGPSPDLPPLAPPPSAAPEPMEEPAPVPPQPQAPESAPESPAATPTEPASTPIPEPVAPPAETPDSPPAVEPAPATPETPATGLPQVPAPPPPPPEMMLPPEAP